MSQEPSILFREVNQKQGAFTRRALLMGGFTGLGVAALAGRLAYLQLFQSDRFRLLSANNQFNFRIQPAPRGRILDRNGVLLAGNRPNFRLLAVRGEVDEPEVLVQRVSQLVPMTPDRQASLLRDFKQSSRFVPFSLAEDLTWEEFSRINVRAPELPGVNAEVGEVRLYPFGGAFAHVIGYVGKLTKEELEEEVPRGQPADPVLLHPGFRTGKQGVEKALDKELRGKAGAHKVEVDARGRVVREPDDGDIPSVPGKDVVLTLDADIQNRALEVFGDQSGAAVMMDCHTGDILCMASAPAFDANMFVRGMPASMYRLLANYERKPLLDKALSGTYPPGSTFKMTTALSLLAAGVDPKERVNCGGGLHYGGRFFHCWGRHGSQDMHNAIKNSCDTYFYAMCNRAGPDLIAATAHKLGFGEIFDIGIPGQKKGLVPNRAYKARAFKNDTKWHPGETLSFAIGQGYLNVNALQLCVMASRLANGRKALMPRLIKSVGGVERPAGSAVPDLPLPKAHLDIVRAGMAAVANDVSGTAYRQSQLGLGPVKMAGKTGTAQVRAYGAGSRKSAGVAWKLKDHNLFVAFAPYDAPRYACAIIVQHGGGGGATVAAPKAREIMRIALLKDPEIRKRVVQEPNYAAPTGPDEGEGAAPPDPTNAPTPTAGPARAAAPRRPA
ncbi:MAG TPA: penicillin-binding protein 2 [Caulobacteraceae bacterium]|jgi:penicillin-binding protein 2